MKIAIIGLLANENYNRKVWIWQALFLRNSRKSQRSLQKKRVRRTTASWCDNLECCKSTRLCMWNQRKAKRRKCEEQQSWWRRLSACIYIILSESKRKRVKSFLKLAFCFINRFISQHHQRPVGWDDLSSGSFRN